MAALAAKAPPPPPPPPPPVTKANGKSPARPQREPGSFAITRGAVEHAHRVVIYGPGGIGKTSLAANMAQLGLEPVILDLEDGSNHLDTARIGDIQTWTDLRDALHSESLWSDATVPWIDSGTMAEQLCIRWVIENVPHEKERGIHRLEDYGWGKGYQHVYETYLELLADLDQHVRKGRHVGIVCHDCVTNAPNPMGDDFIRYEPRLQSPTSGKASIRHRVREWCNDMLFVGYDVSAKDGKGKGSGTRTIFPAEMPTHWAKSRTLRKPIQYIEGSADVWRNLLNLKG